MGIDAPKSIKPPVTPKPAAAAPAPATQSVANTTAATAPAAQPTPSVFDTGDPHVVANRLGQDTAPQALGDGGPVLTARELEARQRTPLEPREGITGAVVDARESKPDDVTAEMTPEAQAAYQDLPPAERKKFAAEYRAADEPTRAAMEHALEEGLASDLLKATPQERAKYVELHTQAAARADSSRALGELDGMLADGELGNYLAIESRAGTEEKGHLAQLLFDGTLRAEDGNDKSTLDYLAEFASQPGEVTGEPAQVPRDVLVNDVLNEIYFNTASQPEGDRNCASIQVVGKFAESNPAAFSRVMTELAETGQTTVGHGKNEQVLTYSGPPRVDSGGLSVAQQIFVESFAQPVDRENGRDAGGLGGLFRGLLDLIDGMTAEEVAQMSERIAGADSGNANYEAMTVPTGEEIEDTPEAQAEAERLKKEAQQTIEEQVAAGEEPTVWIEGEDGQGHWVRVLGVIEIGPFKIYRYDDGTGVKMASPGAFMETVGAVVYNTETSDVPPGSYNSKWDDPGTGLKPGQGIGGDD